MNTKSQFGLPGQIAGLLLVLSCLAVSDSRATDSGALAPDDSAPTTMISEARLSLAEAQINDWGGVLVGVYKPSDPAEHR